MSQWHAFKGREQHLSCRLFNAMLIKHSILCVITAMYNVTLTAREGSSYCTRHTPTVLSNMNLFFMFIHKMFYTANPTRSSLYEFLGNLRLEAVKSASAHSLLHAQQILKNSKAASMCSTSIIVSANTWDKDREAIHRWQIATKLLAVLQNQSSGDRCCCCYCLQAHRASTSDYHIVHAKARIAL